MKQKEVSKWLKGITIAIALMGIVFFFFVVPVLADEMRNMYPEVAYLYWPGLIYGGVIGIACYAILLQFWKVCCEIGKDNSFSKENADSFVMICRIALVLSLIWFGGLVYLSCIHCLNPGIAIFMIVAIFISIVIMVLAAALSHLILKAYEMKQENEFTI